jgi:hypothetical protein
VLWLTVLGLRVYSYRCQPVRQVSLCWVVTFASAAGHGGAWATAKGANGIINAARKRSERRSKTFLAPPRQNSNGAPVLRKEKLPHKASHVNADMPVGGSFGPSRLPGASRATPTEANNGTFLLARFTVLPLPG